MADRLGSTPPGAQLAVLLAGLELGAVPDEPLLEVLRAEARQAAHQQARLWAAMAEIGRRAPMNLPSGPEWTPDRIFDSAAAQISAELRLSRFAAERELQYALTLQELPAVAAALRAGELDRVKTVVLLETCHDLTPQHRDKVLAEVLPRAATMRVSALKARVQRLAIALDPEWAERRFRAAVRLGDVVSIPHEDGTVTLAGQNMSPDQVAAAQARIRALAKVAKRAGAHARVHQLRITLFAGLLSLRFLGMTQTQIITELVTQFPKPVEAAPAGPRMGEAADPAEEPTEEAADDPAAEPVVEAGVELHVNLAVLLGLCDAPGELPGLGPILAPLARELAEKQRRGQWRFAIVDADGRLLFDGITRHRPTTYPAGGDPGGIVELHVPTWLLDPALIEEHPAWARLLTDLATQFAQQAGIVQDPEARHPGRRLRRHLQIKTRTCTFPGCRRPASDTETDHCRDYARGGVTLEANLGPACDYHHRLKTTGGWRVVKRDHQTYAWISPLGRRYVVRIEPVAPPLPTEQDPDPPGIQAA